MKSADRILAQRYGRGFDSLSRSTEEAAAACEQLRAAAAALKQAKPYMQDPAVASSDKKAFVGQLFGEENKVSSFLKVLLSAKRYYLLDACVAEVGRCLDKRQGVVRAQVQTAFMLSDAQKKKVEQTLSTFTGKTAQASFEVRPELLGGMRARIGDTLIDGTLQGRFAKLQEELTK